MRQWIPQGLWDSLAAGELPKGTRPVRPVGIIDIGSNSVRLVVYEGHIRTPLSMFNEKATAALGKGMGASGRLNPEGVEIAHANIARWVRLAKAMGVERLDVLATAAVRDAADGPDFVRELERRNGITIKVCSGEEEAQFAALGVLCAHPDADGIVADIGGGSLELVEVGGQKFGKFVTLPLGVLRLEEDSEGNSAMARQLVAEHMEPLDWLDRCSGRNLYAVGGAWRAIARLFIAQENYPLHVLDNYRVPRERALGLLHLISTMSAKSLEQVKNVSKRRVGNMPFAAAALEQLIRRTRPDSLIFSMYGLREGNFFANLPEDMKRRDPLICSAMHMARAAGRFPEHAEELMAWMEPLFPDESPVRRRLRHATCLMGDTFWSEHPDYRALQAFLQILRLPFMGLEHRDRAGIALAVYHRYKGDGEHPLVQSALLLMTEERKRRVETMGLALRLAHAVSGGAPGLLPRTRLEIEADRLVLILPEGDPIFLAAAFEKLLIKLAANVNLSPEMRWE